MVTLLRHHIESSNSLSYEYFIFLALGAAAGGFINGLAGFGTALLALGFWLQVMSPVAAVSTGVIMSVLSGIQGAWIVRRTILKQPKRMALFLIPGIIGMPIGVSVLAIIEPHYLRIAVGCIMVLYGGFFTLKQSIPKINYPTPIIDGIIGFIGGVLGGAAALSGALPTMWCAMRTWTKIEIRAVLQPYNIIILALAALLLASRGHYTWDILKQIMIALPITMLFSQIGIFFFKRLTDNQFRRLLVTLMLLSGIIILTKEAL